MAVNQTSQKSNLRVPPQNIDSEKALLGSIMLKPDILNDITTIISPESFYAEKHRMIYKTIFELFGKNEPIDILSVSSRMKEKKQLDQIGGRSYLAELVNLVPSAGNAKHYAGLVQKTGMMRNLINAADYISQLGYDEEHDLDEMLDKAEKKIYEVTESPTLHKFTEIKDSLGEAWDRIDHLHKSDGELRGVQSGFKDLDNMLSGFQKSDLIVVAARPSMGKSSLALDIARRVSVRDKVPVGVLSLEMSNDQVVDRFISAQASVDLWRLRTGKLSSQGTDNDYTRIQNAMGLLSEAPIYIDDTSGHGILQIRAMARRLQASEGLGLLIIDYLQLMEPRNAQASPVQQISEISRSLKGLARELNIPVVALSQLSRAVEQRTPQRPRLSDLRDSGAIEQDSDVVMFIYREDRYRADPTNQGVAEIIIAKHRNGPVGSVKLFFNEKSATFTDIDKERLDSLEAEQSF